MAEKSAIGRGGGGGVCGRGYIHTSDLNIHTYLDRPPPPTLDSALKTNEVMDRLYLIVDDTRCGKKRARHWLRLDTTPPPSHRWPIPQS